MAQLVTLTTTGVGRRYAIAESCVIGRHHDCDIQIVDAQLSKHHASFSAEGGQWMVEDLGSLNGVFVNGERIDAPTPVTANDVVSLGSCAFIFEPDFEVLPTDEPAQSVLLVEEGDTVGMRTRAYDVSGDSLVDAVLAILWRVLTDELSAEVAAPELMGAIRDRLPFDSAALLIGTAQSAEVFYLASKRPTVALSKSLMRAALEERRAFVIPDARGETHLSQGKSVIDESIRSVLLCPLLVGGVAVGAVYFAREQAGVYDDDHLEMVMSVAPLMAIAVAQSKQLTRHAQRLRVSIGRAPLLVGESQAMQRLRETISRAAAVQTPVLVEGETGVGKELVARALHAGGPRGAGPFVAVNCGALPEHLVESELFGHEKGAFSGADRVKPGQFELARSGTLFLDEVGELPPAVQVKLLRALQERTFYRLGGTRPVQADFRLVSATNRDLDTAVQSGTFREDLYYRLNVLRIEVPPLRQRADDVALLADHFVDVLSRELGSSARQLSDGARRTLVGYRWPGNIRELRNVIERAIVICEGDTIDIGDLPTELFAPAPTGAEGGSMPERVALLERQMVVDALKKARGKKVHAAELLGISRPTLDRKIRTYDIDIFGEDA